jgi:lambda family phage minor tail protein L
MSLLADVQQIAPGALISLFKIDFSTTNLPVVPDAMYLYPGVATNYGDLVFGGQTYTPFPLQVTGMTASSEGPLPRPVMSLSNVQGFISGRLALYNDFIGARVEKYRTFAKYLDEEPAADPNAKTTDIYFVEQKKSENNLVVQLQLRTAIDILDARLPARNMLTATCPWAYKSTECSWPGTDTDLYFDADDASVVSVNDDVCGKRLTSCMNRFAGFDPDAGVDGEFADPIAKLPFGGFPSLGRTK